MTNRPNNDPHDASGLHLPAGLSRRRFLTATFGAAGAGLILAACGGDDDSSSSPATTGPAGSAPPTGATSATTATTQVPSAGVTGEVVIWHPYSQPERQAALQQAYDAFMEANPGATVRSELVPFGDFPGRWPAAQAANELPDVVINIPENLLATQTAGAIDSAGNQAVVDAVGGESFFYDGYFEKTGRLDGEIFSLPHYAHNRLNIYRQDRLTDSGLSVPSTMDETLAVAEALNSPPDSYGFVQPLAQGDVAASYLLWIMTRAHGGSLITPSGESLLASDEAIAAAEFLGQLGKFGPDSAAEIDQGQMFNLAYSGFTSMQKNSAAIIGIAFTGNADFPQEVGETLNGTHMPLGPDGGRGDLVGAISMTVMKGANSEGAVALAQSLYDDDNLLTFLKSIPLFMFPQTNNIDIDAFLDDPVISAYPEVVEETLTGIREGSVAGFEDGPNRFIGPVMSSDAIEIAMQEIELDGRPAADALADAHEKAVAVIEDEQRRLDG